MRAWLKAKHFEERPRAKECFKLYINRNPISESVAVFPRSNIKFVRI